VKHGQTPALVAVGDNRIGKVSLLPFALSLFMDGVHTFMSSLVGGLGGIAIAIWFSRGSHIARYIMIIYLIFGLLFCGLALFLLAGHLEWAILIGVIGAFCGYCLWVSMSVASYRCIDISGTPY
jgi:hypothetical protein